MRPAARSFTGSYILTNIFTRSVNNSESEQNLHINKKESINHLFINKILLNQNLSVTQSKLVELLKVKGVEINLPVVTPKDKTLLAVLTGKSPYKGFFGVYIFIHKKKTGQKYVGSSNYLRRIMNYYFKGDFPLLIFTSSSKRRVRGF